MADSRQRSSSALLLSVLGGAVLGAAGLGWWLLSEADRRRSLRSSHRLRLHDGIGEEPFLSTVGTAGTAADEAAPRIAADSRLEEKVRQLNRAIDEVRRQLEQLQPLP
jgi:hypothetical protein